MKRNCLCQVPLKATLLTRAICVRPHPEGSPCASTNPASSSPARRAAPTGGDTNKIAGSVCACVYVCACVHHLCVRWRDSFHVGRGGYFTDDLPLPRLRTHCSTCPRVWLGWLKLVCTTLLLAQADACWVNSWESCMPLCTNRAQASCTLTACVELLGSPWTCCKKSCIRISRRTAVIGQREHHGKT